MESKVYTVNDVMDLLGIGRSAAYEYIKKVEEQKEPFRVIKVGKSYRIPKESFDKWLGQCWLMLVNPDWQMIFHLVQFKLIYNFSIADTIGGKYE